MTDRATLLYAGARDLWAAVEAIDAAMTNFAETDTVLEYQTGHLKQHAEQLARKAEEFADTVKREAAA